MESAITTDLERGQPVFLEGVLIIGAGPSGLATSAALKMRGLPSTMIEKEDCIGSLWKKRTYDRLHLHIPKKYCALPHLPFPSSFPEYPSRDQVVEYLETYAKHFQLKSLFCHTVVGAAYEGITSSWRVLVADEHHPSCLLQFVVKWLVVASGENSHPVLPQVPGAKNFKGPMIHSSQYKNGLQFSGNRVLVVGSGNSGMEIALDLVNRDAYPSLAVRGQVHVLPRDILGMSTFSITTRLLGAKIPIWLIDMMFLFYSWLLFGDLSKVGLVRPKEGPMEIKMKVGKTPVLDVGALGKIKSGHIKVLPGVVSFNELGASFLNNETFNFDVIIMATGYRSNISAWLEGGNDLFAESGHPKQPYPNGWKGKNGLFAAGLTRRGLQGACHDAEKIAEYIHSQHVSISQSMQARSVTTHAVCEVENAAITMK